MWGSETNGGQDDGGVEAKTVEGNLNGGVNSQIAQIERNMRTSRANQDQAVPSKILPFFH